MSKHLLLIAAASLTAVRAFGGIPEVVTAVMVQDASRDVKISYTLSDSASSAVVTLDVETNTVDGTWVSIGGANFASATGDVWKRMDTTSGTIRWRPTKVWPGKPIPDGGIRAKVTAWPIDDTPDYLVVGLTEDSAGEMRYYPSADCLPGGLLENDAYRSTHLVLRKIPAKGIEWTMGSVVESGRNADERTHSVTLTNNYYLGVFEVTQAQWANVLSPSVTASSVLWPSYFSNEDYRDFRPVERVSYNRVRTTGKMTENWRSSDPWPTAPHENSFLGQLRARTGIDDFDLPSEAQWEFACRAGNGEGRWGDGTRYSGDGDTALPGRTKATGGYVDGTTAPAATCDTANGTAEVGSYAPNAWGLYDMHGNVLELCNDCYVDDIRDLNGEIAVGETFKPVLRGGAWSVTAKDARAANRYGAYQLYKDQFGKDKDRARYTADNVTGLRLFCRAGLK